MKRLLINYRHQWLQLATLVLILLACTKVFSQTAVKAPRNFAVSSKSYNNIILSMADDNANTTVTIFIEQSINGGAYSVAGSFNSQPSQPNPTYVVTGLSPSTPYCFRARARNSNGAYSGYSSVACETTDALPVPSGLTATTTGTNSIQLNWSSGYGGKDSGIEVAIERSVGSGGPFTQIGKALGEYGNYTDNSAPNSGTQYCYRIRGMWGAAGNSGYSNTACATTQQGPPAAPNNLTATAQAGYKIYLHWNDQSNNENGFIVERSTDNVNFTLLTPLLSNIDQYTDGPLTPATTYYYRVKAYTGSLSSLYSNVANATTFPAPPTAPNTLKAQVISANQIDLSWMDISNNETGFEIERSQDGTNFIKIGEVGANVSNYQNTGLSPSTKYWYRVRSKNAGGFSEFREVVEATTPDIAPNSPQNLSATPISNVQINLSWGDNSGNETGFEIERSQDGTNFTKIADLGANITSYQNAGLSTLTKYWYRVRAKNAIGNSGYSNVAEATTKDVPPNAPSELTALTISSNLINLAWKDNSGNESGFEIERSTDGASFGKIGDASANASTFQSTGLTPNTKYWYRVRSINSEGGSAYTNIADATTQDVAPPAPQNLSGTPVSNVQINLSWTDISGTYGNETGYELERSADGNSFTKIADLAANITTYQNTGLSTLTRYWYRLRAKNVLGFSPYSNVADVTTFDVPPIAPTNLTATMISSSQINLNWKDNSTNETAFDIERSTDGTNFVKIGEAGANVTTYQSTGLSPATRYWYRVNAKNTVNPSAYTNVADATTKDVLPNAPLNLSATANDYFSINLAWTDNSINEAKFLIERSTDGVNFTLIDSLGKNVNKYLSKGLKDQTTYYYRIRAWNAIGYSAYSNIASATTPKAPLPAKPENLKAVPIDFDLIQLTWAELSGNSETVIIERSLKPDADFIQIGRQPAGIIQFPDREILDIHDYYYRIKAVNAAGSSPYSDVAKVAATAIITGTEPATDDYLIYIYEKLLHVKVAKMRNASLTLFNMRGSVVSKLPLTAEMTVDLSSLPSGIYIVLIHDEKRMIKQKVILY